MEIRLTRSNKKTLEGSFQKPANSLKPFTEKWFESHTMRYLSLSLKITLTCTFTAQREQRCSIQSANDTFTRASSRWKALIDRGIRLLTLAASNRLFVTRTIHTRIHSRITQSQPSPRHYRTERSYASRFAQLRLLLISFSVSSKLHRIRPLPSVKLLGNRES